MTDTVLLFIVLFLGLSVSAAANVIVNRSPHLKYAEAEMLRRQALDAYTATVAAAFMVAYIIAFIVVGPVWMAVVTAVISSAFIYRSVMAWRHKNDTLQDFDAAQVARIKMEDNFIAGEDNK